MFYFPSTWKRVWAYLLDRSYVTILRSPVIFAIFVDYFKIQQFRLHWSHLAYFVSVSFMYEFLSLYFYSTTLGKWQMGLTVINRSASGEHRHVTWEQALLRVLASRLSFFFDSLIYVLAFFNYNRTHVIDWIADTQVVAREPRSSPPTIRWVLASFLILAVSRDAIRTAAINLNSVTWKRPFVYYENNLIKALIEEMEGAIEFENDDD